MRDKTAVSASYMEQAKKDHAWKRLVPDAQRSVLLTGAEKASSIGDAIEGMLLARKMRVMAPSSRMLDVTKWRRFPHFFASSDPVDTLICCHGQTHLDWLEDQPPERIVEVCDVNLTGTMLLVREFVRRTLAAPHRKQIVLIGSMAYAHVLNGSAPYCASKAGLAMFARCAAWELAPKGYDVFVVHPSNTEGAPMTTDTITGLMRYRGLTLDEAKAYWGASLPRDHWLQTGDIAGVVSFLLTEGAGYLSGTQLDLGGGQR